MNITVVGTGYVGLVTGACFAEFGVQVVCADNDADKVGSAEAFEVCEYGRQPTAAELRELFPFFETE